MMINFMYRIMTWYWLSYWTGNNSSCDSKTTL